MHVSGKPRQYSNKVEIIVWRHSHMVSRSYMSSCKFYLAGISFAASYVGMVICGSGAVL